MRTNSTGYRLDFSTKQYNVTMTAYGDDGRMLEIAITPEEMEELIKAYSASQQADVSKPHRLVSLRSGLRT